MAAEPQPHSQPKLSWREGLFLVGPDPLTSPYYSSGALIVAGVGYATPGFQIGLYLLLFLLAPLYIEAVLLTLSNGGTYVMTRYALSHWGKLAIIAAAVVGVIIRFRTSRPRSSACCRTATTSRRSWPTWRTGERSPRSGSRRFHRPRSGCG